MTNHTIIAIWFSKVSFIQFFCVFFPSLLDLLSIYSVSTMFILYCAHLWVDSMLADSWIQALGFEEKGKRLYKKCWVLNSQVIKFRWFNTTDILLTLVESTLFRRRDTCMHIHTHTHTYIQTITQRYTFIYMHLHIHTHQPLASHTRAISRHSYSGILQAQNQVKRQTKCIIALSTNL